MGRHYVLVHVLFLYFARICNNFAFGKIEKYLK